MDPATGPRSARSQGPLVLTGPGPTLQGLRLSPFPITGRHPTAPSIPWRAVARSIAGKRATKGSTVGRTATGLNAATAVLAAMAGAVWHRYSNTLKSNDKISRPSRAAAGISRPLGTRLGETRHPRHIETSSERPKPASTPRRCRRSRSHFARPGSHLIRCRDTPLGGARRGAAHPACRR